MAEAPPAVAKLAPPAAVRAASAGFRDFVSRKLEGFLDALASEHERILCQALDQPAVNGVAEEGPTDAVGPAPTSGPPPASTPPQTSPRRRGNASPTPSTEQTRPPTIFSRPSEGNMSKVSDEKAPSIDFTKLPLMMETLASKRASGSDASMAADQRAAHQMMEQEVLQMLEGGLAPALEKLLGGNDDVPVLDIGAQRELVACLEDVDRTLKEALEEVASSRRVAAVSPMRGTCCQANRVSAPATTIFLQQNPALPGLVTPPYPMTAGIAVPLSARNPRELRPPDSWIVGSTQSTPATRFTAVPSGAAVVAGTATPGTPLSPIPSTSRATMPFAAQRTAVARAMSPLPGPASSSVSTAAPKAMAQPGDTPQFSRGDATSTPGGGPGSVRAYPRSSAPAATTPRGAAKSVWQMQGSAAMPVGGGSAAASAASGPTPRRGQQRN